MFELSALIFGETRANKPDIARFRCPAIHEFDHVRTSSRIDFIQAIQCHKGMPTLHLLPEGVGIVSLYSDILYDVNEIALKRLTRACKVCQCDQNRYWCSSIGESIFSTRANEM